MQDKKQKQDHCFLYIKEDQTPRSCFRVNQIWSQWYVLYDDQIFSKVETIQEDSLGSIPSPSPSVTIQIISGKAIIEVIRQNIAGWYQQTFE